MKNRTLVVTIACLVLLAVCIGVPVLLTTHHVPEAWEFTSGDLLGYIGAVLGGLITLIGVAATIYYEHRETWEERVRASAPCLVPTLLGRGELDQIPRIFSPEEGTYFVLHPKDRAEIKSSLAKQEYEKWLSSGEETKIMSGFTAFGPSRIAALAFIVENVGLGPAINYRVRIVPSSGVSKPTDRAAGNSALRIGDSYCAAVYCDTHNPSAAGEYRLELTYLDLYGYRYSDSFEFEISDDGRQVSLMPMVGPTRTTHPEVKELKLSSPPHDNAISQNPSQPSSADNPRAATT